MNNTPTPRTDAEIEEMVNGLKHMADDHLCCRATVLDTIELLNELKRERDQLREWAAREIQQMPDMVGGVPFAWEKLGEKSRSMWRMRAEEAASRLAAQGLERKTK
jgi:hypothetical protein